MGDFLSFKTEKQGSCFKTTPQPSKKKKNTAFIRQQSTVNLEWQETDEMSAMTVSSYCPKIFFQRAQEEGPYAKPSGFPEF